MATPIKIDIPALVRQLETFKVDQEQKVELAQALMLGAALGLRQQIATIGKLARKLEALEKKYEKNSV